MLGSRNWRALLSAVDNRALDREGRKVLIDDYNGGLSAGFLCNWGKVVTIADTCGTAARASTSLMPVIIRQFMGCCCCLRFTTARFEQLERLVSKALFCKTIKEEISAETLKSCKVASIDKLVNVYDLSLVRCESFNDWFCLFCISRHLVYNHNLDYMLIELDRKKKTIKNQILL